jgi:hypothetical protein
MGEIAVFFAGFVVGMVVFQIIACLYKDDNVYYIDDDSDRY